VLGEGLGEEEDGLEIGVDHRIPVFLGEVHGVGAADDAGIVDEDVGAAEGADGFGDDARDGFDGGEIGRDRNELPPSRLHLLASLGRRRAADGGDVGAGFSQ
jgi:hypothetical protein